MSKRKFAVTPVQPLVLEFPNGDTMEAIFTIDTMMMISEKFGDLTIVSEEYKHKPYDLATKLLYCGLIAMGNEVTYEEVQAIAIGGGLPLLAVIFESVAETFEGLDNIEDLSALDMTKLEDIKKSYDNDGEQENIIDWDFLYYIYCVIMKQPEESFFNSSVAKVIKMISLYNKHNFGEIEQTQAITSMKEIEGW